MAASRLRDHGLSIVLTLLFAVSLVGQTLTGWHVHNEERAETQHAPLSLGAYLGSGHFGEAVFENWESEFLQMGAYIVLTVFLFQRGSAESKDPDEHTDAKAELEAHRGDPDAPGPVRKGGWRLKLYTYSLAMAFGVLFLASAVGHAVAGLAEHNDERLRQGEPPMTMGEYVGGANFWFESFQNWQSEFLAVLAIVVLSIWLRMDSSPESKPTWAPHRQTGTGG